MNEIQTIERTIFFGADFLIPEIIKYHMNNLKEYNESSSLDEAMMKPKTTVT